MGNKRKTIEVKVDNKGRILQTGECQLSTGEYTYRITDDNGKRQLIARSWRLVDEDVDPPQVRSKKPPLREQIAEYNKQIAAGIVNSNMTVLELVDRYLSTISVKRSTASKHRSRRNFLATTDFAKRKVSEIKTSDAKKFMKDLNVKYGKKYGVLTSLHGILRPAFALAENDDLILKNPFAFSLSKVVKNDTNHRDAYSPEQETAFLEFVKTDNIYGKYYDAFYILFHTGLRISEFCGLTLEDIDLVNNIIVVNKQLLRKRGGTAGLYVETPKTKKGSRVIPINNDVAEAFKRAISCRRVPATKKEPVVDGYKGFLWLSREGNPTESYNWRQRINNAVRAYNKTHDTQLPDLVPHICRHTYCSEMVRDGMNPKILQGLMGHSNIAMTMDIYTTLCVDAPRAEVARIAKHGA